MSEEDATVTRSCHIYLICRRPVVSIRPESFKYDGEAVSGELIFKKQGQVESVPFAFPFPLLDGAIEVGVSDYPHRELVTRDKGDRVVRHLPAWIISLSTRNLDLHSFEVLYVGQAFAEGKRSALERLRSHSTLQAILADTTAKQPDDEIMLFAFKYEPYSVITSVDGTAKQAVSGEEDSKRFVDILSNPLSEHAQICLAEAGLIRYFQPPYNETYKQSFPRSDQKILNACYDLDFSGLIVEIDTEDAGVGLYSQKVSLNTHHIAKFELHDPTVRRGFFTFVTDDGLPVDRPDVIQRSDRRPH